MEILLSFFAGARCGPMSFFRALKDLRVLKVPLLLFLPFQKATKKHRALCGVVRGLGG